MHKVGGLTAKASRGRQVVALPSRVFDGCGHLFSLACVRALRVTFSPVACRSAQVNTVMHNWQEALSQCQAAPYLPRPSRRLFF